MMMTKFALIVVAVLAFASMCLARPSQDELDDFEPEFELLESGYNQAVAALEAAVEQDPANEERLDAFKRDYEEHIELLKKGIEDGSITAETLDNNDEYQKVKAEIQQLAHKGQLGVSADEVLNGVQKGLDIGSKIIGALGPLFG